MSVSRYIHKKTINLSITDSFSLPGTVPLSKIHGNYTEKLPVSLMQYICSLPRGNEEYESSGVYKDFLYRD